MSVHPISSNRTVTALIILGCLFGLAQRDDAIAGNFKCVPDFSIALNPNDIWSYGYQSPLGSALVLYTVTDFLSGNYSAWLKSGTYPDVPLVAKNEGNGTLCQLTFCVPKSYLHLHPGKSCEYSVVRFTAPVTGTYKATGDFAGLDKQAAVNGKVSVVYVICNGTTLFTSNITSYLTPVPFSLTCVMTGGDALDFVVGCGDGDYYYDSTGLRCKVEGP